MAPQSLALVYAQRPEPIDAIRTHGELLVKALRQRGVDANGVSWAGRGGRSGALALADVRAEVILLQYNPFSYGRWGFAPRLILQALRLRSRRGRARFGLIVHEPFVPMVNWRWAVMGTWQRIQLWALAACSDVILVTTESWRRRARALRSTDAISHLPVGSNIPDMRVERQRSRSERGWPIDQVVLAAFGTADPARLADYIVAAANGVAQAGLPVSVLNLGAGAPALPGLDPSIELVNPGSMESEEVARQLAAADIFLAPYADGLSTRRTTLMAALQHGLPVVGTSGKSTDATLLERRDAVVLIPDADAAGFADAALRLARDRSAREELGERGRELYRVQFDWPVLAERLVRSLAT